MTDLERLTDTLGQLAEDRFELRRQWKARQVFLREMAPFERAYWMEEAGTRSRPSPSVSRAPLGWALAVVVGALLWIPIAWVVSLVWRSVHGS